MYHLFSHQAHQIARCLIAGVFIMLSIGVQGQARFFGSAKVVDTPADSIVYESVADSLLAAYETDPDMLFELPMSLPDAMFTPAVFDRYRFLTPLGIGDKPHSGKEYLRWLEDLDILASRVAELNQSLFIQHPELVKYNIAMLPEPPARYVTVLDPSDFSITVKEAVPEIAAPTVEATAIKKRHWIRQFNASLQFSQAYVSPNWYQGGNNNLNALGNIYYNVKLNEAYHPNLLFETTAQYKLGMNNAPDDSIHTYNLSEDRFQINTTFGVRAIKHWYYSFTGQFKTQLLNTYKSNTRELTSAFLSPATLTAGVGMTYTYANVPKTFDINVSIAPVSYNLTTCTNSQIDPTKYNIEPGHKTLSKFGSTLEVKMLWKVAYNIVYSTRLFAFTDYDQFTADWENTLGFEINRFLTTQIYAHLRYDTKTPRTADSNWKKLQIKEIFSIGFTYKFATV